MLKVFGNKISLTRGDSASIILNITTENGEPFIPTDKDEVLFTVRKNPKQNKEDDYEFQIEITDNTIKIKPEHTKNMTYRTYLWDIQINYQTGDVETILNGELELTVEVT